MNEEELKQIYAIINDIWQFMKQFGPEVCDNDEYWDGLLAAADAIWEKHEKHPLCRTLLTDCAKYIESQVHHE